MSSLVIKSDENSPNSTEISTLLPLENIKSKKCSINNLGIMSPEKNIHNSPSNSLSEETGSSKDENNPNNSENNIIKIRVIDDNNKIIWSKNPFSIKINDIKENKEKKEDKEKYEPNQFKATQEFIRTVDKDSIELIIPCKPMLSSTASKSFMQEYSKSKRYQEDLKSMPFENISDINNKGKTSTISLSEETINEEDEYSLNDLEELIKYQESHLPVPIKEKDNEKFKILTMKKMKRKTMPPNKSVRKFAEDREPYYEKEFRITNSFCKLRKKKVVHSSRRIYSSNFILNKGKEKFEFKIFRDKDIGVYEYWQTHIHEAHNDEDVETDEEQKTLAKCFTLGEIKESFHFIKNRNLEDTFVNFNRFAKFRSKEENEKIQKELWNLKCKIQC